MPTPQTTDELIDIVRNAAAHGTRLELRGGGSKATIGADREATIVDMRGFAGVIDYDPPELVLTVRAGTPLAEIETLLVSEGQMLAFEPWDHGPMFGMAAGAATIGGVVAAGVSGSRRLTMGAPRDHLLGFEAVSGRGERFIAGGKVVKNVTGYDLSKLMAGSWGRLAAMTEMTLKVLPRPRLRATMAIEGLGPTEALAAMARAMGSPAEICVAAHIPSGLRGDTSMTLFLLQGFEPSVVARQASLPALLAIHGAVRSLSADEVGPLWDDIRHAAPLQDAPTLWRINVSPSRAHIVVATLEADGARWFMDWAGGLIWAGSDGDPALLRTAAERAEGHAMLVRAPAPLRAAIPAHHPRSSGVAALEARVRRAFDPVGLFETGRFLD